MTDAVSLFTFSELVRLAIPEAEPFVAVFEEARDVIAQDLDVYLECHCVIDLVSGEPIRATLDEAVAPHTARLERLLSRMDAFLGRPQ